MYVDSAREADLSQLKAIRDDVTESRQHRYHASKTFNKIMAQLKDSRLAALRERLMKAGLAQDKKEVWKITNQIKDYRKEELFKEGEYSWQD